MNLDWYQQDTRSTAQYPEALESTLEAVKYTTLGLVGEAGELANKLKKVYRDAGGVIDNETRLAMAYELGDVLWYVARLADELGCDLSEVATFNLDKLKDRQERGVIGGSGDDR